MWEEMVIHMVFGIVRSVVKNPAKAEALKTYLLEVADSIYTAYGVAPPAHE